ncbi:MAG TPA: 5'/3'-nucleotidase SurE [Syntrophomonadaceae bacterium]|nr:5'/3'-nucleotidase SurE [Syntrophomonadaceae bacterium]
MRILLTNDDGVHARGLQALVKELSAIAEIYLAAPDRERSATGHSITVFEPIKAKKTAIAGTKGAWAVWGTPVDCVKLAIARLIDEKIDLVVSGINHGPNLGTDVLYSGTVSAAAEGVIMGSPSLAVSLNSYQENMNFDFAAQFTRRVIQAIFHLGMDNRTLLNINIPDLAAQEIKGLRISRLGVRNYDNLFEERLDPRGNTYYWLGGGVIDEEQEPDSDVVSVESGYISLTPIHLDLTNYRLIEEYREAFSSLDLLQWEESNGS